MSGVSTLTKNPSPRKRITRPSVPAASVAALEQLQDAEEITLQRVDDAGAVARPENVSGTWVEHEYDDLEIEQGPQWVASGIETSRPAEVEAAGLQPATDAAERITTGHTPALEASAIRYVDTQDALAPFRRRTGGKLIHYTVKGALVLGDAVGVTLLGINIGDYPVLAGLMSISAATAAVTAGLVGAELRVLHAAERRQCDLQLLNEKQKPFGYLFSGANFGSRVLKLVGGVSVTAACLIASAIFAGRAEIEGALVGGLYGGIALAVAAASFIESFMYADEIADIIDGSSHAYDKEIARHQKLAGSALWSTKLERSTEAASIVREHEQRGAAAKDRVRALKWGILRRNPGVAGHGPGAGIPGPVGRTDRKTAGAK